MSLSVVSEQLEDHEKEVDDVEVKLDASDDVIVAPHPVHDHPRVVDDESTEETRSAKRKEPAKVEAKEHRDKRKHAETEEGSREEHAQKREILLADVNVERKKAENRQSDAPRHPNKLPHPVPLVVSAHRSHRDALDKREGGKKIHVGGVAVFVHVQSHNETEACEEAGEHDEAVVCHKRVDGRVHHNGVTHSHRHRQLTAEDAVHLLQEPPLHLHLDIFALVRRLRPPLRVSLLPVLGAMRRRVVEASEGRDLRLARHGGLLSVHYDPGQ
mmetsp:Transcript_20040/g.38942  ORF Transcript_20040/g.38942 Transcript_20040/m.38942 type:complete len:271 (+) Transcript_20040:237-1049(+)